MNTITEIGMYLFEKIIWFYFRILCRGKVIGEQNLINGPFLMAANHVSYLDWLVLFVYFKRKKREITFLAKKKLFIGGFTQILMKHSKSIYVDQDKVSLAVFRDALDVIRNGGVLGVFPEGERSITGKLLKAKTGMVSLAVRSEIPIVPTVLNGFYQCLPKTRKIPKIHKCWIEFGKPVDLDKTINSELATNRIMKAIAQLTNQEYDFDEDISYRLGSKVCSENTRG